MFTFANSGNCISCCTPLCMCKFSKCIPCRANLAYENSWNACTSCHRDFSHMQILEMHLLLYNTKVKCKLGSSFPFLLCSNLQMWIVRCLVFVLFQQSVIYREGFLDVSQVLQEKWCFVFAQRCKQFHTPTRVSFVFPLLFFHCWQEKVIM
jgi:hypothetical protein